MFEPIITGILLGLTLAMLIGPVFFMLLNTSLKRGFVPAAYLAVGVMLSDAVFITIAYFSSTMLTLIQTHKIWVGGAGGAMLIVFGLTNLFKRPMIAAEALELPDDSKSLLIDTGKGFMMNTLNPFVLFFWIGVASTLAAKEHFDSSHTVFFFTATLSTILTTDLLKAWLATRLKQVIRPGFLIWLNRISGIGLIIFGCKMLVEIFILK